MPSRTGIVASSVASFAPTDIAGLRLWYDASDVTSFTFGTGSLVSQWNDKSGGARHVSQATSSAQPNRNGTRNSLTTVTFDAGDILNYSGSSGINVGTATFFIVFAEASAGNCGVVALYSASGGNDYDRVDALIIETTDETAVFQSGRNVFSGAGIAKVGTTGATPFGLYRAIFRNDGTLDVYRDGTVGSTVSRTGAFATAAGGVLIGGRYLSGAIYGAARLNGDIAEIVAYDSVLSAGNTTLVETYLRAKWGTP